MIRRPLIGITSDCDQERYFSRRPYADQIVTAGGIPVFLPCRVDHVVELVGLLDGVILSGGDDPIMEPFGHSTHPMSHPVDLARQEFEIALLQALRADPSIPVLGICLGMQYMCLHAGGVLDQHLPDSLPTHALHWGRVLHPVRGEIGSGQVLSHHRQAITNPGRLRIIATSPDGVIEAVRCTHRPYYIGVQWHPERTDDPVLGIGLLRDFVLAASGD